MTDATHIFCLLENRAPFFPGGRIKHVAAVAHEQSQAVINSPTTARRINDEDSAIALKNLETFANRHAHSLPRLIGSGDADTRTAHRERICHGRDIKVLLPVSTARPARPNKKKPVIDGKDCAIDGPAFGLKLTPAPIGAERVRAVRLEHPRAVMLVLAIIRSEVDVPFAGNVMKLGGPDPAAVGPEWR